MTIATSEILQYVHPDALAVSVRTACGAPCRKITIEALKALIARKFVVGIVRGQKLRKVLLTVSPDVAFAFAGKSTKGRRERKRVVGAFHSQANDTTLRIDGAHWTQRRHKNSVCLGYNPANLSWCGLVG